MSKIPVLLILLAFIGILSAQDNWQVVQAPTEPLIYSVDNVFFLNQNEGWIVGNAGSTTPNVILKTSNAGQTWITQSYIAPGSDTSWADVYFVDSNTGWVVGDDGLIWKTTDGGANWTEQLPDTNAENFDAVYAVDANVVYACGTDGLIWKTTDGGATWIDQSFTTTSDFADIYAFNADTAFAISTSNDGVVIYTSDGGATWNSTTSPFPGPGISVRQYACTGLPGGIGYIAGYHGTVFRSTDYGATWTNVANIFGALFKIFYSIDAFGNSIWAGDSNGKVYYSSDAGATWDTLAFHTANNIEYIKAFSESQVYVYGEYAQLYETTDAGQNFTPLIPWPNVSWWDMVATTNKLFVASITGGELTISEDLGQSWTQPVTPVPGLYGDILDLFFLDDNTGFFAGRDGLIGKTTDAGLTWTVKPTSYGFGTNKSYNFVYFRDAQNGYAGGSSAILQTTTDGGETWTESVAGSGTLYDCYFIDASVGIISASSGKIFRTTDGGTSWTEIVDFGSTTMRTIYFIDNNTGFICASSGYLYKTTDAGLTWTEMPQLANVNSPGDDPDLYRIEFVNDTTAYMCGEDGALYMSSDTGNTWTQMTVPPEAVDVTLQAMAWTSEETGFLAGQNGYIFATYPPIPPSPLVLNEVMWDVTRDDAGTPNVNEGDANGDGIRSLRGDEFIELVNSGTDPVDISGYQLLRRNGYLIFTFPGSTVLDPGEYTVVFGGVGPSGFGPQFPPTLKIFASKPGEADSGFADLTSTNMLGAGDNVVVVNPALNDTIAEIYWGDATPVSSKALKTEPPNTVNNQVLTGTVRQAITRNPDVTGLWDLHTQAATDIYHSPGAPSNDPYVGINNTGGEKIPESFMVYQNYPNPFNPETSIRFDLPYAEKVTVTIYNTLGQVVRTLYQGNMKAGQHALVWDSRNDYGLLTTSGIYFYRIKAGQFSEVRKMILMK